MYQIRPEEALLLELSRLTSPADYQLAGINFERFARVASWHETAPLVYRAVKQEQGIPDAIRSRLKDAYLASAGINTRNGQEAMRIVQLLRDEGIEAMPLKGPFSSEDVLGDAALYPSSDIDLLVRPDGLERAASMLLGEGYEEMDRSQADMLRTHYHLAFTRPPYVVELHWNLAKRYYRIPPEFWWEESRLSVFGGIKHLKLSPERYFMALSFRAMSHEFSKLKFLVLPAELINQGAINFGRLRELSGQCGMRRLTAFMLRLCLELLGAQVPEEELRDRLPSYHRLKNAVLEDLFLDTRSSYRRVLYLSLLDTACERMRVITGRLVPSPSELRMRYNLPERSLRVWIYYLLNPLFLPALMLRRRRRGA